MDVTRLFPAIVMYAAPLGVAAGASWGGEALAWRAAVAIVVTGALMAHGGMAWRGFVSDAVVGDGRTAARRITQRRLVVAATFLGMVVLLGAPAAALALATLATSSVVLAGVALSQSTSQPAAVHGLGSGAQEMAC